MIIETVWRNSDSDSVGTLSPQQCESMSVALIDPTGTVFSLHPIDVFGDQEHQTSTASSTHQRAHATASFGSDRQKFKVKLIEFSLSRPLRPGFWSAIGLIGVNTGGTRVPHVLFAAPFLITPHPLIQTREFTIDSAEPQAQATGRPSSPSHCTDCLLIQHHLHVALSKDTRLILADHQITPSSQFKLLDELYLQWFNIDAMCAFNNDLRQNIKMRCPEPQVARIPRCNKTAWSSFKLDLRSDLSTLKRTLVAT